MEIERK